MTSWLQPVVELNYLHLLPLQRDSETLDVTAGAVITPGDDWSFYLGYQRTLTERGSERYGTWFLGTSYGF